MVFLESYSLNFSNNSPIINFFVIRLTNNICQRNSLCITIKVKEAMKFFLNVFSEFAEFSDKKLSLQQKDSNPSHLLCERPACYHSACTTHVRDRIFKYSSIHASVIYLIPWIHWIQWKCLLYRKNSNAHPVSSILTFNLQCYFSEKCEIKWVEGTSLVVMVMMSFEILVSLVSAWHVW